MNEKIKELYFQCNKVHGDYSNGGVHVLDVEKFAELVIHECLTAIECGKPEIVSPELRLLVSEDIYSHWKFYEPKD